MTSPSDPRASAPTPVPATGTARLFLWCDRGAADPTLAEPGAWADFLHRLGLTGSALPDGSASRITLCFAGMSLTLLQESAAWAALDPEGQATAPVLKDRGSAFLVALECDDAAQNRRVAAQRMCALAALLAPVLGGGFLYWQPARLWSSTEALNDAVVTMEAMGMPPVLHLVAFDVLPTAADGEGGEELRHISSRGLAWFCGYEMRLVSLSSMSVRDIARRAARLAIDSLLNGDPSGPIDLPGLTEGETVHLDKLEQRDGQWWLPVSIVHGTPH